MPKPSLFWNDRFAGADYAYGTHPNVFIRDAAARWLPTSAKVLELGAGEGRNAVHLARQGHAVTALDYAQEGLRKTRLLASGAGVSVETIHAGVTEWTPDRTWDAVVVTFLHLDPDGRATMYRRIREALPPGGILLAEWFRPEQRTGGYMSGGPPNVNMMVTASELRTHFAEDGIEHLASAHPVLDEGPHHQGDAATVQFVWRAPETG